MCLIAFAWDAHPDYRLLLAANRDELHKRPSQDMHWWPDQQDILAGRDLQAGGAWLAMSKSGRFATVPNYCEGHQRRAGLESRGGLVTAFVAGKESPADFVAGYDGYQNRVLEVFVALLQAYIFAMLTAVFIGLIRHAH